MFKSTYTWLFLDQCCLFSLNKAWYLKLSWKSFYFRRNSNTEPKNLDHFCPLHYDPKIGHLNFIFYFYDSANIFQFLLHFTRAMHFSWCYKKKYASKCPLLYAWTKPYIEYSRWYSIVMCVVISNLNISW